MALANSVVVDVSGETPRSLEEAIGTERQICRPGSPPDGGDAAHHSVIPQKGQHRQQPSFTRSTRARRCLRNQRQADQPNCHRHERHFHDLHPSSFAIAHSFRSRPNPTTVLRARAILSHHQPTAGGADPEHPH